MKKTLHKIQYFIYALMYSALILIGIKGSIILISEMKNNFDYSMLIYVVIGIFAISMFIIALYNCIKEIFKKS